MHGKYEVSGSNPDLGSKSSRKSSLHKMTGKDVKLNAGYFYASYGTCSGTILALLTGYSLALSWHWTVFFGGRPPTQILIFTIIV
jgi:hypothetical protein